MSELTRQPARSEHTNLENELRDAILAKLTYVLGRNAETATDNDWFQATALAVRDRCVDIWMTSQAETKRLRKKRVYYLSIEFLVGRLLLDTLTNLRLTQATRQALRSLGVDLDRLRESEPDAALGNGGLGRLAACFIDSMAALGIPGYGYGIRYENGLFEQRIRDGWQEEAPEDWLARGNPWEFAHPDTSYIVQFGGVVEYIGGDNATARANWYPHETVLAVPYDTIIGGWRGRHANALRLWSARAPSPIQLSALNHGDVVGATAARARAEAISRVLYPNDATPEGQELRLRQEYFFTSASLQDLCRRHLEEFGTLETLADYAAVQLNDTHPAIAVAELMRLLIDDHDIAWGKAWDLTRATLSYTNHTLLPEALETWPAELLGRLLPRHLQIIYLINWFHLKQTEEAGFSDPAFLSAVSLVDENADKSIRMANLAFVGSHCVNGVSALHTELLRKTLFHDLARTVPTRIVNKTNGITFRRWLYDANEPLTALLTRRLGERVLDEPRCLEQIETLTQNAEFVAEYQKTRMHNKLRLADILRLSTGVRLPTHALFDVHIKRIHEYKRQLLNILDAIALYQAIRAEPEADWVPRVKIFAGKAAASYERAKLIIKLANDVAAVVNNDPVVADRLKIIFAPNYSVSLAERIIPAADLSEQISTAGMEASGTGNMKLALNGAITIGTLDGANIEIRDHVGADNVIIFGLTAAEVKERQQAQFKGAVAAAVSPRLAAVLESLAAGAFSPDDPARFAAIVQSITDYDRFMVAADFDAYWNAQRKVDALWRSPADWWRMSILNTARMAWFSSDRTIREYARDIWNVPAS
ncbi:MAG TPA: glycogen/starch/alpha-glucan phosphorylase [Pseudolabrys sp.]|nr:glycogen/starch/alpha-glucan phosphorylase [Pseudolabrys sp.]